jgi:predicted alpha-1,2-mannosidase
LIQLTTNLHAQLKRPVDLVYPLLDASHGRWFYFSSACHPFGLVSLFPDNRITADWGGGYRYEIDTIQDFSHVHEWQLAGVAVMPVTFTAAEMKNVLKNYASPFSHKTELIKPGYHSVDLDRYDSRVELTASNRAGFHRYHFPKGKQRGVIFELGGILGPSRMTSGGFGQVSATEIRGFMVNGATNRRPKPYTVYFSAVFNQPIKSIVLYQKDSLKQNVKSWSGTDGRILVEVEEKSSAPVLMKVGISYTSEKAAFNNQQKEIPHWAFEKTMNEASVHWNEMLGRIKIEGSTETQQRRFYTDLWHAIQGRRIITDVDGKYTDCTGAMSSVKTVPLNANGKPAFEMYNSDSFWGAQWTLNTLWQLVYPEIAEGFCLSFLEYYKNGGLIPRGPSGGNYTFVMTGAQLTPFYSAAWQKGIRGFDMKLAYEATKKNHFPGGMMSKIGYEHRTSKGGGIEYYIDRGYVPYPLSDTTFGYHQDGAAITLENAYHDWCLAQLAKTLDKQEDYQYFLKRSENFRNLFNSEKGFMVPKNRNGNWRDPYDPLQYEKGFEEGNGAQFTWFVPHNLPALFELMGGKDSAISKLNRQFELSQPMRFADEHPETASRFPGNHRVWVNYSNQPSIQTAFIFNHAGAPWLTQHWSRLVIDSMYSQLTTESGYSGDEDQGLMGSLSALMKMGIFQMTGGCEEDPRYDISSPLFSKITISLQPRYYKAKQFVIQAKQVSARNRYIQSATLNNKPFNRCYFNHSDINRGSTLVLIMGDKPNYAWGVN